MATQFIFDRAIQEQEEAMEAVLQAVKKKPYPDENTTVLANFIDTLFKVGLKRMKPIEQIRVALQMPREEMDGEKLMPAARPLPEPPEYYEEIPMPAEALTPMPAEALASETLLPPPAPAQAVEEAPAQVFLPQAYTVQTFGMNVEISNESDESGNPVYRVNEPEVSEDVLKLTKEYIKDDFQKDFKVLDDEKYINKKIEKACRKKKAQFTSEYAKNMVYYLKRDLLGFRRIDPMMYDNNVKAIYCDGINKPLIIELGSTGKVKTNVMFSDAVDLNALLNKLAKATGSELSEAKPILDTFFQGYKIQAVLGIGGASSKLIIKKES